MIAVNPYQWYHHLYTTPVQQSYAQCLMYQDPLQLEMQSDNEILEPHVYETSTLAYRGLCMGEGNQSILVSGESGAGKTETVKILLNDLATIQQQSNHGDDHMTTSPIVQRVLDSNPLLEAFGNAKTVRNDNSSRFGKYIQLQFLVEDAIAAAYRNKTIPSCILIGSRCEVYLLEKSRVVHHEEQQERTYHIFYQLLAASDEYKAGIWDGLVNTDNESFSYVGYTPTTVIENKTDAERFEQTITSLELIGIVKESLRTLLRAICIVLQLGNLVFVNQTASSTVDPQSPEAESLDTSQNSESHHDGTLASHIDNLDDCRALAELMGVDATVLSTALTIRTVRARNEVFHVPLSAQSAKDSCDAFAKEIYAKTFLWLVRAINDATCAEQNYDPTGIADRPRRSPQPTTAQPYGIIGLLDIFGFESFVVNRFEQLCINYANEKLQQKFTQDIFRNVQIEYEFEGIALDEITYDDNTDVLDLVEGRMGLIAFLNEECVRPGGSDKGFVMKAAAMNKDNACFIRENSYSEYQFGINHYAGRVVYEASNFVTKNMDTLPTDLQLCATKSTNTILAKEFLNQSSDDETTNHVGGPSTAGPMKKKAPSVASSAASVGASPAKRSKGSNIVGETVWTKFRNQLTSLMTNLKLTKTRYIRCIKPNTMKQPYLMEHLSTVEQLRCAGVVAAVTISRSAFPNRLEHDIVLDRFKALWLKNGQHHYPVASTDASIDPNERVKEVVRQLLTPALSIMETTKENGTIVQGFVLGKTRTYFRAGALEYIENERVKCLSKWAVVIQRIMRTYIVKTRFNRVRTYCICLQAWIRMALDRRRYMHRRVRAINIQCWLRAILAQRKLVALRRDHSATLIQTRWRMLTVRTRFKADRKASVLVQAMVRGALQRPKYQRALVERREEAKLENQVIALQRKLEEAERRRIEAEKKAEEKLLVASSDEHKKEVLSVRNTVEEKKDEKESTLDAESETSSLTNPDEPKASQVMLSSQQQTLMDESGKMLEYLRKEVFKLRSHNAQLHSDFNLLKDNNQRLMDANASAGASFAALNQHAKQLAKVNEKLVADVQSYKQQVQKLSITQVELKEELKMKQATYVAEVHSRLQYQKALSKIIDVAQERCRDDRLVEEFLRIADTCEAEYMNGPTGINSRGSSGLFPPARSTRAPSTSNDSSVLSSFRKMWS
jgi:myosin V